MFYSMNFDTGIHRKKMKWGLGGVNKKFQPFHMENSVKVMCLQNICKFLKSSLQYKGLPSEMFCINELTQNKQFYML